MWRNQADVILSVAKDPRSSLHLNDLRTTAEILRYAQDDTFRISSHLPSRGITALIEGAEPRSGDRRSAIIKTALSPLPGLFRRIVPAFSHGCRRGPHSSARRLTGSKTRSSLFQLLCPWGEGYFLNREMSERSSATTKVAPAARQDSAQV